MTFHFKLFKISISVPVGIFVVIIFDRDDFGLIALDVYDIINLFLVNWSRKIFSDHEFFGSISDTHSEFSFASQAPYWER